MVSHTLKLFFALRRLGQHVGLNQADFILCLDTTDLPFHHPKPTCWHSQHMGISPTVKPAEAGKGEREVDRLDG